MFSKSCEYALRAIVYVATHASQKKKAGIKEIAATLDIPVYFLGKILQMLVKHTILESAKGPNGGFFLHRNAKKTAVIDVIEIMDGLSAFKKCALGLKECSDKRPCPIHDEFKPFRDNLKKHLASKKIMDLASVVKDGSVFVSNRKSG